MTTSNDYDFQSSSDRAYEIIYNMILDGTLKPGEKLIRRKLAKESGVSTIPVLEALLRLEADGIVESRPYRGSRVIQVTHDKIMDWYALREAVECQVARILATRIKEHELQDLYSIAYRLDNMEKSEQVDEEFWALHYGMHQKMAELTDRQSLVEALMRINFFHLLQRAQIVATEHHNQIPSNNHEIVINAIASRDPRIAEDAMREHIHHSGIFEINGKEGKRFDESPVSRKIKADSGT